MSVSLTIVSIIILLIMFGVGQRILDSLRLNDKEALIILILICIGLIIPPIWIGEYFCFSIGGFLIPLGLSIYMLISCGWSRDLIRTIIGTILIAAIIYILEWVLPADPESMIIDNTYIYGVISGVIAYVLGRSRRNAFISCLFGITFAQLVQWVINFVKDTPSILGLGIGGAFGTYVVAIIISVALSEFLGRCFECAVINKENKEFNFKTHTYSSVKNKNLDTLENNKNNRIKNIELVKNAELGKNNKKSVSKGKNTAGI